MTLGTESPTSLRSSSTSRHESRSGDTCGAENSSGALTWRFAFGSSARFRHCTFGSAPQDQVNGEDDSSSPDDLLQLGGCIADVRDPLLIATTFERTASRRMWSSRSFNPPLETTSTSQPRKPLSSS